MKSLKINFSFLWDWRIGLQEVLDLQILSVALVLPLLIDTPALIGMVFLRLTETSPNIFASGALV